MVRTPSANTTRSPGRTRVWAAALVLSTFSCFANDAVVIESTLEPAGPYIQQQVIYTVRTYAEPDIEAADLHVPLPPGAVVLALRDENKVVERTGVGTKRVFLRQFALFPQTTGALAIPAPRFTGTRVELRKLSGLDLYGTGNVERTEQPIDLSGPSKVLHVRPALAGAAGTHWLPARDVYIQSRWHPDPWMPKIGVPATQIVTLGVGGLSDVQLPEITPPVIQGVSVYPSRITQSTRIESGVVVGTRIYKFTYVPRSTTDFRVPPITVPWWNLAKSRMDTVSTDAFTPARASSGQAQSTAAQQPAPDSPPITNLIHLSPNHPGSSQVLVAVTLLMAAFAGIKSRVVRAAWRMAWGWYRVRQALASRHWNAARDELLGIAEFLQGTRPLTLQAAVRAVGAPRMGAHLAALDALLYDIAANAPLKPAAARALVVQLAHPWHRQSSSRRLPGLYSCKTTPGKASYAKGPGHRA